MNYTSYYKLATIPANTSMTLGEFREVVAGPSGNFSLIDSALAKADIVSVNVEYISQDDGTMSYKMHFTKRNGELITVDLPSLTHESVLNALGYTPANQEDVDDLSKVLGNGGFMKADMAPLILNYAPSEFTDGYTGQLAYNTTDSGVYICIRGYNPNKDAGSEGVTMFSWSKAKAYKSSNVAPTTSDAGNFGDLWVDYKTGNIYISAGRTVGSGGYIYVWNKVGGTIDLTEINEQIEELSEAITAAGNEVYILQKGETVEDAPEEAKEIIDPYNDNNTVDFGQFAKKNDVEKAIVYVTPQMFGAVGDGVADDTEAMQNAFNDVAENGKYLFIPQGKYKVTRPITVNFHRDSPTVRNYLRKIIGAGCGSYESMWDNSVIIGYNIPAYRGVIELIGDGNTWDTQTTIEDLAIMCNKASCDYMSFALMYGDARNFKMSRVKLEGHNGIYARCGSIVNENGQSTTHGYGQINVKFEQCDIFTYEDSTRGFAFLPEGVVTGVHATMDNISVDSCCILGVWVITSVNVIFQSCHVCIRNVINKEITTDNVGSLSGYELDYATGFYVAQAMSAVFQNCYFEDYRRGIHITPTLGNVRNVSIMNCYINPGCNQFNTDGTRLCADYGVRISNGAGGNVVRNVLVQNNVFRFIEGDTEFVIANVSNEFANHFVFRDNCTTNTQEVPKVVNTTKSGYDIQNGADSGASVRSITNSDDGKTFTIELTNDKSYSFNTSVSTPVKGTDYFTDEEINEITGNAAALAKAGLQQIPTPTWVESVSQMTDKSKNYVLLESGNIWAYMKRTKTIEGGTVPNFTNCMDVTGAYIKDGYRYSHSSAAFKEQASDCAIVVPIIEQADTYTIRVRGANKDGANYYNSVYFGTTNTAFTGAPTNDVGGVDLTFTTDENEDYVIYVKKPPSGTWSYLVFQVGSDTVDASKLIVTVNEEITYTTTEPTVQVVEEWTDTGHHI